MLQKKICMLGAFAVGKTSLVKRYVQSIFSDKYLSTVGVKIDKKVMQVGAQDVTLMLWDLYGEDNFQKIQLNYLRGSSGYLLVVDGTRLETLSIAFEIEKSVLSAVGPIPHLIVINKADLRSTWEVQAQHFDELRRRGHQPILASAKTGEGIEEAFQRLTRSTLGIGT